MAAVVDRPSCGFAGAVVEAARLIERQWMLERQHTALELLVGRGGRSDRQGAQGAVVTAAGPLESLAVGLGRGRLVQAWAEEELAAGRGAASYERFLRSVSTNLISSIVLS